MRNHVESLEAFVQRWDMGTAGARDDGLAPPAGAAGHINDQGDSSCATAPLFTRWDRAFSDAVEPGVRALVLHLTNRCNLITYSSCEGHRSSSADPPSPRHVGILPREGEYLSVLRLLRSAARRGTSDLSTRWARLEIRESVLTSRLGSRPCIDIVMGFEGDLAPADECVLFAEIEELTGALIDELDPARASALQARRQLLTEIGAMESRHSGGSLLAHLVGTARILGAWGADRRGRDAGLFHAVFGTESFHSGALTGAERGRIASAIGKDAEELVYLFGMRDGSSFASQARLAAQRRLRSISAPKVHATVPAEYVVRNRSTGESMRIGESQLCTLAQMSLANAVQQVPRMGPEDFADTAETMEGLWPLVPAAAQRAIEKVFVP